MFEMCSVLSVTGSDRPAIAFHEYLAFTESNHWLNGDAHSLTQLDAVAPAPVIGDFGSLMHVASYTMPYKFTHYPETILLTMGLYRIAHITEALAMNCLFNTFIE